MNKSRLLLVGFAMVMALPCFAKKKVSLEGKWHRNERIVINRLPVEAWIEDDNKELLLEFSENLGTVQVTVMNSAGQIIYNQTVDTDTTLSLIVKLDEVQKIDMKVFISNGENLVSGVL